MSRKIWLILLILFLVVVGVLVLRKKTQSTPQGEPQSRPTESQAVEVTFSDQGYAPNSLRVKAGTSVTFKNQSTTSMWPASNPHPVHSEYPEFDAKHPYSHGESYSFTFARTGTWGYHDHLHPNLRGTISVE